MLHSLSAITGPDVIDDGKVRKRLVLVQVCEKFKRLEDRMFYGLYQGNALVGSFDKQRIVSHEGHAW